MSFEVKPTPDYITAGDVPSTPVATPAISGTVYGSSNNSLGVTTLGYNAGRVTSAPHLNTVAIGRYAADGVPQGMYGVVAVGDQAMRNCTDASQTVAIGNGALLTGSPQTTISIGTASLSDGSFSVDNTVAVGNAVLFTARTSGAVQSVVAIGSEAGYAGTLSNGTVIIGRNTAKTGTHGGVIIGNHAAFSGYTASSIIIGDNASYEGSHSLSVAIGPNAGKLANTSSSVAIGRDAMYGPVSNVAGTAQSLYNIAIGYEALKYVDGCDENIAIGYRALQSGGGERNIAIGSSAMIAHYTGYDNIGIGRNSLNSSTAYGSIWIGTETSGNSWTSLNNVIVIGYQAQPSSLSAVNQITLGNSDITVLRCAATTITALSDARYKEEIVDSEYGLSLVNSLRPVQFKWNMRNGGKSGIYDIGFTAQDLMSVEDSLDAHETLRLTYRDNPEALEASYGRLIPVLVKAIQELSAEVDALKSAA